MMLILPLLLRILLVVYASIQASNHALLSDYVRLYQQHLVHCMLSDLCLVFLSKRSLGIHP